MRLLFLLTVLCVALVLAKSSPAQLLIDSAPSVVSYQGSSQTHTRFVIAPMGRALGYVEPTNLNRTFHTTTPDGAAGKSSQELLQPRPVYVP